MIEMGGGEVCCGGSDCMWPRPRHTITQEMAAGGAGGKWTALVPSSSLPSFPPSVISSTVLQVVIIVSPSGGLIIISQATLITARLLVAWTRAPAVEDDDRSVDCIWNWSVRITPLGQSNDEARTKRCEVSDCYESCCAMHCERLHASAKTHIIGGDSDVFC
jgi:hypothetical protein